MDDYDFLYFGHCEDRPGDYGGCYIWFKNEIAEKDRKKIENLILAPLVEFFSWDTQFCHFCIDDYLELTIPPYYNPEFNDKINEMYEKFDNGEISDEELNNELNPTEEEWQKFKKEMDTFAKEIHKQFPIVFLLQYQDEEEDIALSQWHSWSIKRIHSHAFPVITEYYNNLSEKNELVYKAAMIINAILCFTDLFTFTGDEKQNTIELITRSMGYDSDIDRHNAIIIGYLLANMEAEYIKEVLPSLNGGLQLSMLASKHSAKFLWLYENPVEHLKDLMAETENLKPRYIAHMICRIAMNAAGVSIKTVNHQPVIEEEKPEFTDTCIEILQLAASIEDCPEKIFDYLGQLYFHRKEWEKCYNHFMDRFRKTEDDEHRAQYFTGLVNVAEKLNRSDSVYSLLVEAIEDESLLNNPYSLSNIIYSLNRRKESYLAVKLTKLYWQKEDKNMIPTLYVNMTDSFIVANTMDDCFKELVKEALIIDGVDENYFSPAMFENIACFYAMESQLEETVDYLKKAKSKGHKGFQQLKDLELFKNLKNEKKFLDLFKS